MDEIEWDIIGQLQKDSRISIRKISKTINISEKTIRMRINKLMGKNIIKPICIVNGSIHYFEVFNKIK
ncbi:Lrp/AsnC family transcriptional regulator [Spiroplasma poulsonii]|uniref:Lrp/AsnC family transcriptional regulator n=1 Tax=Spiroplasma poulsonii TaxID=2138 RepID=UPI00058A28B1